MKFLDLLQAALRRHPWAVCLVLTLGIYFGTPSPAHAWFMAVVWAASLVSGALVAANEIACSVMECGEGTARMVLQHDCYFCSIFVVLSCQGGSYSRALYALFAPMALSLARFVFLLYLAIAVGKIFVWPSSGGENLKAMVVNGMIYFFACAMLQLGVAGGHNPWIFEWIFDLLQQLTLAVSAKAIGYMATQGIGQTITASVPNFDAGCMGMIGGEGQGAFAAYSQAATAIAHQYADLWAHVELGIWPVIALSMQRLTPDHFTASGAVAGIILAAPYVFVLGVFGAFMVQTMFYFIAVTAGAPFLLAGLMFKTSQGWALSAFRLLVGGCMTIFFSAIAMGFTLTLIAVNVKFQMAAAGGNDSLAKGLGKNLFGRIWDGVTGRGAAHAIQGALGSGSSGNPADVVEITINNIGNAGYWQMFLIGFISIMLHLAAPRIASNISGSNDSATTAATVVGAGQFAASKVLGVGRMGAFSAVGSAGEAAGGILGFAKTRAADLLAAFRGAGRP